MRKQLLKTIKNNSWDNKKVWDNMLTKDMKMFSVKSIVDTLYVAPNFEDIALKCSQTKDETNKYFGMSQSEILAQWQSKTNKGSYKGNIIDSFCENFFDGNTEKMKAIIAENKDHKKAFKVIIDKLTKLKDSYVGSQIWVNSVAYPVRGVIDSLFYDTNTGTLFIIDYKSHEKDMTITNKDMLLHPYAHMKKNELALAAAQVNLYRYIIGEYNIPEIKAIKGFVLQVNNDTFKMYDVDKTMPYDKEKVCKMIENKFV